MTNVDGFLMSNEELVGVVWQISPHLDHRDMSYKGYGS